MDNVSDTDDKLTAAANNSWSCQRPFQMEPTELWELMWRLEGQRRWLHPDSNIKLFAKSRCALYDEAGVWRYIYINGVGKLSLEFEFDNYAAREESTATSTKLKLEANKAGGSVLHIDQKTVSQEHQREVEHYWQGRLDKLRDLVAKIRRRRKSARQAVVVIHGIGEQQPGATLGDLVGSGVMSSSDSKQQWVKPDQLSNSYELRKVTLKGSDSRPTTHVFEFYWAHIIRDTTLAQTVTWLFTLLRRWRVPPPLRPLWVLAWLLIITGVATLIGVGLDIEWMAQWFGTGAIGAIVIGTLWSMVGRMLAINFIGDAARYLMPHPANVAHRQKIRQTGVDLIKNLHESGKYDRIIILGHSLGSVIAYDIVTHAWAEMNETHRFPISPSFKSIKTLERELACCDVGRAQTLQKNAWHQCRKNTQPWLVTDLVTVGSPLTYADFLVELSHGTFEQAKANRTLPACPPIAEIESRSGHHRVSYDRDYRDSINRRKHRTFVTLHHAAPFAVTRWTNLYFKVRFRGLSGDLIGGPLQPKFGQWVDDVPLDAPKKGVAHTWYWRRFGNDKEQHLECLAKALKLDCRDELLQLISEIPAYALLR